jgi:hypothetical protein
VRSKLKEVEALDFDLGRGEIPHTWAELREEARPIFRKLNIWKADLVQLQAGNES